MSNQKYSTDSKVQIRKKQYYKESLNEFLSTSAPFYTGLVTAAISPLMYHIEGNLSVATSMALLGMSSVILSLFQKNKKVDVLKEYGVVPNEPEKNFYLNCGYIVKEHTVEGAGNDFMKKNNIVTPILLDETAVRTHMTIAGTTGSGKTVFAKSLMRQQVGIVGGGFMMIEGKGDNGMFHEIFAEMALAGREKDFFFLNFLDPKNSNTINLLEVGDFSSIKDTLSDYAFAGKESDVWSDKGKLILASMLEPLIILRDSDLMFEIDKCNKINNIADLYKYKKKLSLFDLQKLLISPKKMFEFCWTLDRVYKNNGMDFVNKLKTYRLKAGEKLKTYHSMDDVPKIHQTSINALLQLVKELGDWEDVCQKESYQELEEGLSSGEAMYDLNVAKGFFSDLFQVFLGEFKEIFGVEEGDINLEDIMVNGKVLHCPLQGINATTAGPIAKMLLANIRAVAKNRGKAYHLTKPFLVFLDEFNSWSKGIEGFGDLLSVTRSYGLSFIIMYQSDLTKTDEGKGLEADQIISNTNSVFLLKVLDPNMIERFNKSVGKVRYFEKDDLKEYYDSKEEGIKINNTYTEKEEDALIASEFAKLKSGQGYCITSGVVNKFISSYLADTTIFETVTNSDIPEIKLVSKDKLFAFIEDGWDMKSYVREEMKKTKLIKEQHKKLNKTKKTQQSPKTTKSLDLKK